MTDAERIELLKQLRNQTSVAPRGEIDQEVAELDSIIEDYEAKIAELEAKLANEDNYLYENTHEEERILTEELLEESFAEQLAALDKEEAEYEELRQLSIDIFDSYSEEIAELADDISAIERRLRKNEIAVSKNMRMQLSVEELEELTTELESKKARMAECENFQDGYVTELKDFDELLAANRKKREILAAKQEKLAAVRESRINNATVINKHQRRLDQDELASLKAAVVALQTRKEHITFDTYAILDKLIADAEKSKEEKVEPEPTETIEENKVEPVTPIVVSPISEVADDIGDRNYEGDFTTPSELDEEREAVVEESSEELIEKKKLDKVKDFLKKHYKKFIAAGLALIAVLTIKGCSSTLDAGNNLDQGNQTTQTQQFVDDEEEPELDTDKDTKPSDSFVSREEIEVEDDTTKTNDEKNPVVENKTEENDEQKRPAVEENDTQKVELDAGEKIGNISDIKDNKGIEHGDEVGTELDSGIKLEDYTEEGKAIVDLTTEETKETKDTKVDKETKPTEEKTLHQTLEEFFGGPISITDGANAYELGENTSEKVR